MSRWAGGVPPWLKRPELERAWNEETLGKLHSKLKDHPLVRWKVQVRKALGLA